MKLRREQFDIGGKLNLRCRRCENKKPSDEFYWLKGQNTWSSACKECEKAHSKKKWREANKKELIKKAIRQSSPEREAFYRQTLVELGL